MSNNSRKMKKKHEKIYEYKNLTKHFLIEIIKYFKFFQENINMENLFLINALFSLSFFF